MTFIQSRLAPLACTVLAVGLLSACDQAQRPTPKAGTVAAAWQPLPDKPLFSDPIVKDHDVLPAAKADTKTPLPPAVPLVSATAAAPAPAAATADAQGGGVNPAAGMAAAVTDSKGAQNAGDGK